MPLIECSIKYFFLFFTIYLTCYNNGSYLTFARSRGLRQNACMPSSILILLADVVLAIHWAFAAFIVAGLAVIWVGRAAGWAFVRNRAFRLAHLGAMGIVVAESLLGIFCPLTEWESRLRLAAGRNAPYETTFIEHWAGELFYWDLPEAAFTAIYVGLFLLMLATWRLVPPTLRPPRYAKRHTG